MWFSLGLTSSGPSGRFHMGVYSFSTSTIEEMGGSGTKKNKGKDVKKDDEEEGDLVKVKNEYIRHTLILAHLSW